MIGLSITVEGALAVEQVMARASGLDRDPDFWQVLGYAGVDTLQKHYRRRNQTPNKLGGGRTFFWESVASAVQQPRLVDGGADIAISHPAIAQKVYGGTITPDTKKALSIPVDAKSHGKSPRVFDHLAFIPSRNIGPGGPIGFLVEGVQKTSTRGKRKGQQIVVAKQGGSLLYVLTRAVHQEADPEALPSDAAMLDSMRAAADEFIGGI